MSAARAHAGKGAAREARRAGAALVVVAAGAGTRLGGPCRKALVPLHGRPLVEHALRALLRVAWLDPVVLVGHASDRDALAGLVAALPRTVRLVDGGARRQDSVAAGLAALDAAAPELVLVHDAARPFPPIEALAELARQAERHGAALLAVPVADTIKLAHEAGGSREMPLVERTLPRARLWAAQTPQAFRRADLVALLRRAAEQRAEVTDEAALYESAGRAIALVSGSSRNFKVTAPDDLRLAEALLSGPATPQPRRDE